MIRIAISYAIIRALVGKGDDTDHLDYTLVIPLHLFIIVPISFNTYEYGYSDGDTTVP